MRGLYTAMVLEGLSRRFLDKPAETPARDVGEAFNLIVGTSTGGILACALAAGYSPSAIVELYRQHGADIFPHPIPTEGFAKLLGFAITHLRKPANDGVALRNALAETFGSRTIGEVYARRGIAFCMQTVDMGTHAPVVIKSGHLPGKHRDDSMTLVDACMATTAAPIILPLARVPMDGVERTLADGGLWANSPIVPALIEALKMCGDCAIEMVSVGTCPPPVGRYVPPGQRWGLGHWRFGIGAIETSLDAQAEAARYQFIQLFEHLRVPVNMVRLHQTAPPQDYQKLIGLDRAGPQAIDALTQLAAKDAETVHGEITRTNSPIAFLADIFGNLPEARERQDKT